MVWGFPQTNSGGAGLTKSLDNKIGKDPELIDLGQYAKYVSDVDMTCSDVGIALTIAISTAIFLRP